MGSIPQTTKSGLQRSTSEMDFVYTKLKIIIVSYLLLDLISIPVANDPYFALGPDQHDQLGLSCFQGMWLWPLFGDREVIALIICLSYISYGNNISDLARYWMLEMLCPSRSGVWMHSWTVGSFSLILDRGLSAWWGAFWHQTFRIPFLALATFLVGEGYMEAGTAAAEVTALCVSFVQSGLLHASGSLSSIADTRPWQPLQFFLLQGVAIAVQRTAGEVLRPRLPPLPRWVRRGFNMFFAVFWQHLAVTLYFDDVASSGLWGKPSVCAPFFRSLGVLSPECREDGHNSIAAVVVTIFLVTAFSYLFISPGMHPERYPAGRLQPQKHRRHWFPSKARDSETRRPEN
ncbi:hypothetical protein HIM_08480 [Hirsutella minnesotensis 3608]|uniref:Wax synthase domain-containing protein n=1 Tax=Hirsutella minnesotensis 3608 TaxID=1043627 RepID=A0A0F7ZYA0_9HYPO|nr:hypothetical protein HIM_08480 [Hirsutella minnesotensis 3608]